MAVAAMKKIRLIGLRKDGDKILDILARSCSFEPLTVPEVDGARKIMPLENTDKILSKRAKLSFAIDFLSSQNKNAAEKIKKAKKKKEQTIEYTPYKETSKKEIIGMSDLYDVGAEEYELMSAVRDIEKISTEIGDLNSQIAKLKAKELSYLPYSGLTLKFSEMRDTKRISVIIAQTQSVNQKTSNCLDGHTACVQNYYNKKGMVTVAVCLIEQKPEILSALNDAGFSLCPFADDATADNIIASIQNEIAQLEKYIERKVSDVLSYEKYMFEFKLLYDFYTLELEKDGAEAKCNQTAYTFNMEGWIPEVNCDKIVEKLKKEFDALIIVTETPQKGKDEPPTLLNNPKLIKPFEDVTNLYSSPNYFEFDPNPIMAVFFFIIFGILTADFGYGLILMIGCLAFVKFAKPQGGLKNLLTLFGICGLSTALMGLVFNGIFGYAIFGEGSVLEMLGINTGVKLYWFAMMDEPMKLLALSIAIGIVHITVGYIIKLVALLKEKQFVAAICDAGFMIVIMCGIGCLAFDVLLYAFQTNVLSLSGGALPEATADLLSKIGMYLLLGGIAANFFTAGRGKKIGGYLGAGFNSIYGLVNLISDILSYLRIFGIALASASIAWAFNTFIGVLVDILPIGVNYVAGVVIFIVMHLFNIALGLLGAYVHNARLQFLEFYGKFYTGEGRLFAPLGSKTKYTMIGK